MFPPNIENAVEVLRRRYTRTKRTIRAEYPIIEITFEDKSHRVIFQLFYINDEYLEIQNPRYQYFSKISHYDFDIKENRWSRNKKIIFSAISDLKSCGLWDLVRNKDFIRVNKNNKNIDKKRLKEELRDILE